MRVLHIVPDIGVSNGVVSIILNYAKAMPDGIVFDIVYLLETPENKKAEFEKLGGNVYRLGNSVSKDLFTNKFNKFFESHKGEWEAVHMHIPYYAVFVVPAAKKAGIEKICCHCHSTCYSVQNKYDFLFKLLNLSTDKLVKQKFACGKDAGEFWYKDNFDVLKNAVFCKNFEFDEASRNQKREELLLSDAFAVGHIGSEKISVKNHKFLFEIFAEILKKKPNAVLMLIGAYEDEYLLSKCRDLNILDRVHFLGRRNDVADLLKALDVFVFPSINEGLPVAVVEAQAASLPCVISENITDEVVIAQNCIPLSLDESAEKWADTALRISLAERSSSYELMKESGWNITDAGDKLADYYKTGVYNE